MGTNTGAEVAEQQKGYGEEENLLILLPDGSTVYACEMDWEVSFLASALTGWNFERLDEWLGDVPYWTGLEPRRRFLLSLRVQLRHTLVQRDDDTVLFQAEAHRLVAEARLTAFFVSGRDLDDRLRQRQTQALEASKRPRGAVRPLRHRILHAMKTDKVEGTSFKTFMQRWQLGPIRGLRAEALAEGDRWYVSDEDGDAGEAEYTWGSLQKMYSESARKPAALKDQAQSLT